MTEQNPEHAQFPPGDDVTQNIAHPTVPAQPEQPTVAAQPPTGYPGAYPGGYPGAQQPQQPVGGYTTPPYGYQLGEPAQPQASLPKPGSKVARIFAALTIVLFVAAGTFGTLWFIERGDHKATSGQLNSARDEVKDNQAKLADANTRLKDADTKVRTAEDKATKADSDRAKAEEAVQAKNDCADAGKALAVAVKASDQKAGEAAATRVLLSCH
jgi:cytoskeletal protein RodZ